MAVSKAGGGGELPAEYTARHICARPTKSTVPYCIVVGLPSYSMCSMCCNAMCSVCIRM